MSANREMTAGVLVNSIGYVLSLLTGQAVVPDMLLTKRRAVDFCRVATAVCPRRVPVA